jgi:hypothetical protein
MKMKTLKFFILLSLLSSCGKEKNELCNVSPIPIYECIELGEPPYQDWDYQIDTNHYLYPCFNPNNSDEIIYTIKNYSTGTSKLYKYNLITHAKFLVFEGDQLFSPDWGSNNWILLNLSDRNIWRIKSDGTELTQLTNHYDDFHAVWNKDGSKFIALDGNFDISSQGVTLYDFNGNILDTLNSFGLGPSSNWHHDSLLLTLGDYYGSTVIDVKKDSILFSTNNSYDFIGGCHWLNSQEFLWSYEAGIFKTNYVTGITELVKSSCQTRMYQSPTYHATINKFVWKRVDLKQLNEFDVEVKSRLFIMNPDGTEEEELILE